MVALHWHVSRDTLCMTPPDVGHKFCRFSLGFNARRHDNASRHVPEPISYWWWRKYLLWRFEQGWASGHQKLNWIRTKTSRWSALLKVDRSPKYLLSGHLPSSVTCFVASIQVLSKISSVRSHLHSPLLVVNTQRVIGHQ